MDEYAVMFGTEPYFARLLFIIFSTLVCVIALNALIAFMTESFTKVQERKAPEFVRQRAGLLTELIVLEHATTEERCADEKLFAWIHCLAPTSIIKTSESEDEEVVQKLDYIERKQQDMMSEHTRLMWIQRDDLKGLRADLVEDKTKPTVEVASAEILQLARLEKKLVELVEDKTKPAVEVASAEISQLARLEEKLVERLEGLEAKLSALSSDDKGLTHLEEKIKKRFTQFEEQIRSLASLGSTQAPMSTPSDPPRADEGREATSLQTTPARPALIGAIPPEVRERLDKIESDRASGELEAARSQYETLIKWCVPKT